MRRSAAATLGTSCLMLAGALVATGLGPTGDATAAVAGPCAPGVTYGDPLPRPSAPVTKLVSGYSFLEGPVWDAGTNTLLMSHMRPAAGPDAVQPASILRYTPQSPTQGTVLTFVTESGSNGLAVTADGTTVVAATQDDRKVSSFRLSDGRRGVVAATDASGRAFNSPNDVTVRADGTVYFTDPSFQRGRRADQQGGRMKVFRVTGGRVSVVDDTVRQPNGIVLSPDGRTLYVGGNGDNVIYKYPVAADGSTGARSRFATVASPDGGTVDCAGNIYWASYTDGKVHVINPAGREIGTIATDRNTTNVAFGGKDRRTLYITSGNQSTASFGLFSISLNVPGFPY